MKSEQCRNHIITSGVLGSMRCGRAAKAGEIYCAICLAAKKRGEKRAAAYREKEDARWAGIESRERAECEANAARDLAVRELIEAAEEFRENDGSLGEYDLDSAHRLDAALAAVRAFYPDKP